MSEEISMFELTNCQEPGCGAPKGRGRPRKGWVKVEGTFADGEHDGRWYCGWLCISDLAAEELKAPRH